MSLRPSHHCRNERLDIGCADLLHGAIKLDAHQFERALDAGLSLDATAYRAMAARARQFANYMFSPEAVAVATRAVYTSLLARGD